jgi:hypothetical protein
VFPSPNFSPHRGGAVPLASLLAVSILRRVRHQALVRSSRSTRVLTSSVARAQAARTRSVSPKLLGFIFPTASDLVHAPDSRLPGPNDSHKQRAEGAQH